MVEKRWKEASFITSQGTPRAHLLIGPLSHPSNPSAEQPVWNSRSSHGVSGVADVPVGAGGQASKSQPATCH
jgi:hypothetical protein